MSSITYMRPSQHDDPTQGQKVHGLVSNRFFSSPSLRDLLRPGFTCGDNSNWMSVLIVKPNHKVYIGFI